MADDTLESDYRDFLMNELEEWQAERDNISSLRRDTTEKIRSLEDEIACVAQKFDVFRAEVNERITNSQHDMDKGVGKCVVEHMAVLTSKSKSKEKATLARLSKLEKHQNTSDERNKKRELETTKHKQACHAFQQDYFVSRNEDVAVFTRLSTDLINKAGFEKSASGRLKALEDSMSDVAKKVEGHNERTNDIQKNVKGLQLGNARRDFKMRIPEERQYTRVYIRNARKASMGLRPQESRGEMRTVQDSTDHDSPPSPPLKKRRKIAVKKEDGDLHEQEEAALRIRKHFEKYDKTSAAKESRARRMQTSRSKSDSPLIWDFIETIGQEDIGIHIQEALIKDHKQLVTRIEPNRHRGNIPEIAYLSHNLRWHHLESTLSRMLVTELPSSSERSV